MNKAINHLKQTYVHTHTTLIYLNTILKKNLENHNL